MKTIFYSVLFCLFFFACKKQEPRPQEPQPLASAIAVDSGYVNRIRVYLQQNCSDSLFQTIDWDQIIISKEARAWYTRLGFRNQLISDRFLLLTTDSLGTVADARDVSLKEDVFMDWTFSGTIDITDLRDNLITSSTITYGYLVNDRVRQPGSPMVNSSTGTNSLPGPNVQELPVVIVIGHAGGGANTELNNYLYLSGISEIAASGNAGSGSNAGSGGGASGSSGNSGSVSGIYAPLRPAGGTVSPDARVISNRPTLVTLETSYTKPAVNLAAYFNCFASIPDAGAGYTVSVFVDLPVNDDPSQVFNQLTGAVGHCFLGLTKTGSGQSVTQYLGFASAQPFSAIVGVVTPGKVVDNGGHKFNASLAIPVSAAQFALAMNSIRTLSTSTYDLNNFNCVDFTLSVVNSFRPTAPIIPEPVQMPAAAVSIDMPQGLYLSLENMQHAGVAALVGSIWNAGNSHGPCN